MPRDEIRQKLLGYQSRTWHTQAIPAVFRFCWANTSLFLGANPTTVTSGTVWLYYTLV